MEFSFTAEQDQFREILARFLRVKSPSTAVRTVMESELGYDPSVWNQLCHEMGLTGIHIPEEHGGAGYGPVELGVVMEEQGRALLCSPYLSSSVMAGYAILFAGNDDQKKVFLPGIADGSTLATFAISEHAGLWREDDINLTAKVSGGNFSLSGNKRFVVDGLSAGLFIVAGRSPTGVSLFTVKADAEGLKRTPMSAMDPTRKLAEIDFSNVPAELLGAEGNAKLDTIYNAVLIAFANEMIGGAQAMLQSAVEYAKLRVQFGRTIGSFQALKHRFADLMVEVELGRAIAYQAAQQMSEGKDVTAAASMAKAAGSDVYLHAARECIQFHGGIGFTWENDTHIWFKRAKSSEVFLGTPAEHRERMLQAMGV